MNILKCFALTQSHYHETQRHDACQVANLKFKQRMNTCLILTKGLTNQNILGHIRP